MGQDEGRRFRLLPSERIIWQGKPESGVPRDLRWTVALALLLAIAQVAILFASLLWTENLPGVSDALALAVLFGAMAAGAVLLPAHLLESAEYVITDYRIVARFGRLSRSMDRRLVTFGRVRWHRSAPGVGDLELVVAVPIGPLRRKQRLVLRNLRDPDRIFALVRGVPPAEHAGDADLPVTERLEPGERVVWGGHPEGNNLGFREVLTALLGGMTTGLAMVYGYRTINLVVVLEERGLEVQSSEWVLLFAAVTISWIVMLAVGAGLIWHGLIRARALGAKTEYVLTDRRMLIRRGHTELSVDRQAIFDVAVTPRAGGLSHLYLVLDTPEGRALADSGAMGFLPPPRDAVPPVLYDVRDGESLRATILDRV